MKIISPKVEIITPIDGEKILKHIEICARNCYKSEDKITPDSARSMIKKLIALGHEAMIEHYNITVKLTCDVGCYDDKTYILTENGWKLFKDVKADEKVFTKTDNGKVCLYPITCIIEKHYKGLLHCYHSSQVNLKVTPDHNMWVFDNHKRSVKTKIWKFLESQNLTNKSYSFDKGGNKERNDCNRAIAIPATTRRCGVVKREFNGHTFDNLAFFEFLGWWATDGYLEKHGNHFIVSLSQFKTKGVQRIKYLLDKLNLDYSEYKGRYRIKSPALADFISKEFYQDKEDYSKSLDFKITPLIRNAYTNETEAFLQGVLGGDGTEYKDGRKIIYTASKQFALDLIELCFRCGKTANYYMANYEKQYASSPFSHNVPVYVVSICRTEKTWFDKTEKNYSEEEYDGKVYCVSLDKHHRLFVMREGKTCWCGNCYKDLTRHRHASFAIECLSGDTRVLKNMTIKELYERSQNQYGKTHNKTLHLRSVNGDGEIIPNKIKDVWYKGVAPVYQLKTNLGYTIKATENHFFKTKDGYKPLKELAVGDEVYVNGRPCLLSVSDDELKALYETYSAIEIADLYGVNISSVYRRLKQSGIFVPRKNDKNPEKYNKNHTWKSHEKMRNTILGLYANGRKPWNKGLTYEEDEGVRKQRDALIKHHHNKKRYDDRKLSQIDCNPSRVHDDFGSASNYICEICGAPAAEWHHINKNRRDNHPTNLMTLCINCHDKLHHGWEVGKKEHLDKIVAVEYIGEEDVYDIEMQSPYNNFVANGFIVHNSTRFCNYSKGKYGSELTFIKPCNLEKGTKEYNLWKECMVAIETYYNLMAGLGCKPDQLRMLLPHSTKADVMMTANLREWRHIFKLRCSPAAHPSVQEVMKMLLKEFKEKIPVVFDDIGD